ncbi:5'-nucleotidase [Planctomycetes bacterium Poly30]|uniref:5'-deoxynucleotidase n=1 Tax=Saltatorellus ferox TaxID=2528018 RepID=A0A518F0A0_9BACT|nr:5'-nucleotidase [Planctomycetes bacterium Poly30]
MPNSGSDPWDADVALEALIALVPLDHLPRTGWALRGIESPESIAGHILGVAHVALALAPQVRPALDLGRVLAMALVHDAPEALSGDLPRPAARHLPAGAKKAMEASLAREILWPLSAAAADAYSEFSDQGTREARFVKKCDQLQLGVRLLAYELGGRRGLEEFWDGLVLEDTQEFPAAEGLLQALHSARPTG